MDKNFVWNQKYLIFVQLYIREIMKKPIKKQKNTKVVAAKTAKPVSKSGKSVKSSPKSSVETKKKASQGSTSKPLSNKNPVKKSAPKVSVSPKTKPTGSVNKGKAVASKPVAKKNPVKKAATKAGSSSKVNSPVSIKKGTSASSKSSVKKVSPAKSTIKKSVGSSSPVKAQKGAKAPLNKAKSSLKSSKQSSSVSAKKNKAVSIKNPKASKPEATKKPLNLKTAKETPKNKPVSGAEKAKVKSNASKSLKKPSAETNKKAITPKAATKSVPGSAPKQVLKSSKGGDIPAKTPAKAQKEVKPSSSPKAKEVSPAKAKSNSNTKVQKPGDKKADEVKTSKSKGIEAAMPAQGAKAKKQPVSQKESPKPSDEGGGLDPDIDVSGVDPILGGDMLEDSDELALMTPEQKKQRKIEKERQKKLELKLKKNERQFIRPEMDPAILTANNVRKEFLELKYSFDCEPRDLFLALTKPEYMRNWLAERVEQDDKTGVYSFHWRNYTESARLVEKIQDRYLKWQWVGGERPNNEFLIFSIDMIPGDVYVDLYILDICEPSEREIMTRGWDKLMDRLRLTVT